MTCERCKKLGRLYQELLAMESGDSKKTWIDIDDKEMEIWDILSDIPIEESDENL